MIKYLCTLAVVGWPGSLHDSLVFGMSSLSRGLDERLRGLDNYHNLGDSAYTLSIHLMKHFNDKRHLNDVNRTYCGVPIL